MFKGEPNLNGRPKGSKNQVTAKVKETISEILSENTNELKERMKRLSDADFIKFYIQLTKFVVPTQRAIIEKELPPETPIFQIQVLDGEGNITDEY